MLGEVRHRHDIDLGLVHEGGRTRGRQRHRVDRVIERLQHAIRPHRSHQARVGPGVAEEPHHPRGVQPQGAAPGCHDVIAFGLPVPGARRVAVDRGRAQLPTAHDVQERQAARRQTVGVERARQGRGVGLACADDDGAAAVEPAQHEGALHGLAQSEPALGRRDPLGGGAVARPFAPFAHHVGGHDVDDLAGQPIAPVHRLDLPAVEVEQHEAVVCGLVLAGVERGREVRQAVAHSPRERWRHGGSLMMEGQEERAGPSPAGGRRCRREATTDEGHLKPRPSSGAARHLLPEGRREVGPGRVGPQTKGPEARCPGPNRISAVKPYRPVQPPKVKNKSGTSFRPTSPIPWWATSSHEQMRVAERQTSRRAAAKRNG